MAGLFILKGKLLMKSTLKKTTSLILVFSMVLSMLFFMQIQTQALEQGQVVSSKYGDIFIGYDGKPYHQNTNTYYMKYNTDGSTSFELMTYNLDRRRLLLIEDGKEHLAYCSEYGVIFKTGDNTYQSTDPDLYYFSNLPEVIKSYIKIALVYGYQEGKALPINGINKDDYIFATQIIIWEFQQQVRTSPSAIRKDNGLVKADQFYDELKDRPAELAYNYILSEMAKHMIIPSFTNRILYEAPTHTLKYNGSTNNYSITLTDTNNLNIDLNTINESGISVTRSGNRYTFTSNGKISGTKSLTFKKNLYLSDDNLLAWNSPGNQSCTTGMKDPIQFFANFQTEEDGTVKIRKVKEGGESGGISFTITGNGINQTAVTDRNGNISLSLPPGNYTLTENMDEEMKLYYEPQEPIQLSVKSGEESFVQVYNKLKRGTIKVIKQSEDGFIEGITFKLIYKSEKGHITEIFRTTDKDGVATFANILVLGIQPYVLEEVDTGIQYVIPENQTGAVEWNKVTTLTFENRLKKFNVTVMKKDAETDTPQGNATLKGAVYGLYQGENLVSTYTTDKDGKFTTDYYPCGDDWTLKEITPSEGYLLDETIYKVGAEAKNFTIEYNPLSMEVTEQVIKGKVAIIKHSDNGSTQIETPEVGAVFQIFHGDSYENSKPTERDFLITDNYGFAESKELPYGKYHVVQISAGKDGTELMKPFTVFVREDGEIYRYLINNATFHSRLKIEKRDAETGKLIANEGIGFQLYKPDGSLLVQLIEYPTPMDISTFYTNEAGWLMLPSYLEYGLGYKLVEVQTAHGYVLSEEPIVFDVLGEEEIITVTKYNQPQKGKVKILKTGEVFSSVVKNDDLYIPQYKTQGLPNTSYLIYADENIHLNHELKHKKDDYIATITTNESGIAELNNLYLGQYRAVEQAADGYVASEPFTFILSYAGQTETISITEKTLFNERQKAEINLVKSMEQDSLFEIGNQGEILNVSFGLYAANEITAADGTVIPADGLLEIIQVGTDGKATFKTDIPIDQSYYVKEISTDSNYIISDEKFPLLFQYEGQETAIVKIAVNDGEAIKNRLVRGKIQGLKLDEDGTPLANALFGLFKPHETDFTTENALTTSVSDIDGSFSFEAVPYGNWTIREIEQPTGFLLDDTIYPVTVSEHEQIIEITIENKYIMGGIEILKKDGETSVPIKGCGILIKDENGNIVAEGYTDGNGKILFDGLRYGKYTYQEFSAPEGYILDETEHAFEIKENSVIIKAEMTNQKKPEPENPQTSDKKTLFMWSAIAFLSIINVVLIVVCKKQSKK